MNDLFSFRRIVPCMALAMLALTAPVSADKPDECAFRAGGTSVLVSDEPGARFELALSGRANQGGAFTGTVLGKNAGHDRRQFGPLTLDFGGGDTLTLATLLAPDPETGGLAGTYVVTGGTGEFEGASGSGTLTADPAAGTFELVGTVCD